MTPSLVVLGASGDLTGRYVLPAVARLLAAGRLPDGFTVTGFARDDWDHAAFRGHAARRLQTHAPDVASDARRQLCANLRYQRGDVTDPDSLVPVLAQVGGPLVVPRPWRSSAGTQPCPSGVTRPRNAGASSIPCSPRGPTTPRCAGSARTHGPQEPEILIVTAAPRHRLPRRRATPGIAPHHSKEFVMLSRFEQRQLHAIERSLEIDDPVFAERIRSTATTSTTDQGRSFFTMVAIVGEGQTTPGRHGA